ncbi:MAG: prolipoprotein diacylglyceryl transferase [Planctomycetota bacterium]|jgi:phosphatidylglycerol:prolipoprotein diacylglycerol transferase|nr:prolipoprotein diacylglyceryl transferase [Planctomycetota bacterium]
MKTLLFTLPIGDGFPVFGFFPPLALGIAVAIGWAWARAKKRGLPANAAIDAGLLSTFVGVAGARFFYLHFDYYPISGSDRIDVGWFEIGQGGLSFFGGLLSAALAVWIYARLRKISFGALADAYAAPLAAGMAIGSVGCLLSGCCWGKITPFAFPLGMRFPEETEVMTRQWLDFVERPEFWDALTLSLGYPAETAPELPVYPTQIISVLGLFGLTGLLLWRERRWKNRRPGQTFAAFLLGYAIGRFFIEFWRDDTPNLLGMGSFAGLHSGQWLALGLFLAVGAA